MTTPLELKGEGNSFFKAGKYTEASESYSKAIDSITSSSNPEIEWVELLATCYSNRAACVLKQMESSMGSAFESDDMKTRAQDCIVDCEKALSKKPDLLKAMFRKAQAQLLYLEDCTSATRTLQKLLHLEPKNKEAIALMKKARLVVEKTEVGKSEVSRILKLIKDEKFGEKSTLDKKTGKWTIETYLMSLMGLCSDDGVHARELARQRGLSVLNQVLGWFMTNNAESGDKVISLVFRILSAACNHASFVTAAIEAETTAASPSSQPHDLASEVEMDKVSFQKCCQFCVHVCENLSNISLEVPKAVLTFLLRALRWLPLHRLPDPHEQTEVFGDKEEPRVEEIPDPPKGESAPDIPPAAPESDPVPYLRDHLVKSFLAAIASALAHPTNPTQEDGLELAVLALDVLTSFTSELQDYATPDVEVDTRMETLEARKRRGTQKRVVRTRARKHSIFALEIEPLFDAVVHALDGVMVSKKDQVVFPQLRQRALPCFARLMQHSSEDYLGNPHRKSSTQKEKEAAGSKTEPVLEPLLQEYIKPYLEAGQGVSLPKMRLRASLSAALLAVLPEFGLWSLEQSGGMQQTMMLVASMDAHAQDAAAEVLCLAAATEGGSSLLAAALDGGAIHGLLRSSNPSTRAAAASAIAKLGIKAKAFTDESAEMFQVLDAALGVIRKRTEPPPQGNAASTAPPPARMKHSSRSGALGGATASIDRALEVVAALAGKTPIKEELVHGSGRVSQCIDALAAIDVDDGISATGAFGLAHVWASLTVTNSELRAIALAEKDMTVEQYEKLAELQRIKTNDEQGNPIEEKKEDEDPDSVELCKLRIKRIAAMGAVSSLVKLLALPSSATKELAARSLRQICVDESSRGLFIQQGGLRACSDLCSSSKGTDKSDEEVGVTSAARREAAHAAAKALITTDPNLLPAHTRLGAIQPLVELCRDVDSSDLQTFEALMSLTNILSVGEAEAAKFVSKGVRGQFAVHYLMFSENRMVRRAASEIFCNIAAVDEVRALLRQPEKVRLWLGLCEDWEPDPSIDGFEEQQMAGFLTARACSGTLAIAAGMDEQVCTSLLEEDCGLTVTTLLRSCQPELVHRAVVLLDELLSASDVAYPEVEAEVEGKGKQKLRGRKRLATHLLDKDVVVALTTAVAGLRNDSQHEGIISMARAVAKKLASTLGED